MSIGVGDLLPEVTLPRLDGGSLTLSHLRDQRRLLFFWGSW